MLFVANYMCGFHGYVDKWQEFRQKEKTIYCLEEFSFKINFLTILVIMDTGVDLHNVLMHATMRLGLLGQLISTELVEEV